MKIAQRAWCLARGIELVTWTFDPMLARNAHFNFRKLACVCKTFHRDFYGNLDDDFNRGDPSDRLEVRWELASERVERRLRGHLEPLAHTEEAAVIVDEEGDLKRPSFEEIHRLLIHVPRDYITLRSEDPDRAKRWRANVARALEQALDAGLILIDFVEGAYVMVTSDR